MLHRVKCTRMTRIVTIATTLQNRSEREFGTDSSLEGGGFEPSVPRSQRSPPWPHDLLQPTNFPGAAYPA